MYSLMVARRIHNSRSIALILQAQIENGWNWGNQRVVR